MDTTFPWGASWQVPTVATLHCSPPTLDRLDDLGPLPDDIPVHPDAGYDSERTCALLNERGFHGPIANNGERAPLGQPPEATPMNPSAGTEVQFGKRKGGSESMCGSPQGPMPASTRVQE